MERETYAISHGSIFGSRDWVQKRCESTEMCIVPMFGQARVFGDCISKIDCWLSMFDQWPLSEVLDKMADMSQK